MGEVFIGSEAIAAGRVSEYELRRWYRSIYRDVYVPKRAESSLRDRTVGAWLWSRRRVVIARVAASALHGARWVDADAAIEVISRSARHHSGLVVRNETLADDEITRVSGLPVTTVARTAFDLGRHFARGQAIARMDALAYATPFSSEAVLLLGKRYRGARGVRRLRQVLPLVDGGAASPRESWLRLLLMDAGFPRPTTQIPVAEHWRTVAFLDMGWEELKVAVEYDGDQHRTDRRQYVKDLRRLRAVERLGWIVVRVVSEDTAEDIVRRVDEAVGRRGFYRDRC